ncbi:MAG: hypothetical protein JXM70_04395 [Pirellulales bacterium]|nr:hypothetical protein [Pirellulales bacterium]
MNALDTDRLAELIDQKHTCLTELYQLGQRQLELVRGGQMTALLDVLAVKQRLIERLQNIERELNPFRSQSSESRQWQSESKRQRCSQVIKSCEALFTQIMEQEKMGEIELVQRRDEAAVRLDGAHQAGRTRGAYTAASPRHIGQLDLASET